MSEELAALIHTLRAAKSAALAAAAALDAAEQMLGVGDGVEEPTEDLSDLSDEIVEPEPDETPEDCTHEEAVEFSTLSGNYKVCHCGWQGDDN